MTTDLTIPAMRKVYPATPQMALARLGAPRERYVISSIPGVRASGDVITFGPEVVFTTMPNYSDAEWELIDDVLGVTRIQLAKMFSALSAQARLDVIEARKEWLEACKAHTLWPYLGEVREGEDFTARWEDAAICWQIENDPDSCFGHKIGDYSYVVEKDGSLATPRKITIPRKWGSETWYTFGRVENGRYGHRVSDGFIAHDGSKMTHLRLEALRVMPW